MLRAGIPNTSVSALSSAILLIYSLPSMTSLGWRPEMGAWPSSPRRRRLTPLSRPLPVPALARTAICTVNRQCSSGLQAIAQVRLILSLTLFPFRPLKLNHTAKPARTLSC